MRSILAAGLLALINVVSALDVNSISTEGLVSVYEEESFQVLVVEDQVESLKDAQTPKKGDTVKVHYTGLFDDEKADIFDSSRSRNRPFSFTLGVNQVIACWDEGFKHLKKGQSGQLRCPPEFAYGQTGAGRIIPPNAYLVFNVELIDITTQEEKNKEPTVTPSTLKKNRQKKNTPSVGDPREHMCFNEMTVYGALAVLAMSFLYFLYAMCCVRIPVFDKQARMKVLEEMNKQK